MCCSYANRWCNRSLRNYNLLNYFFSVMELHSTLELTQRSINDVIVWWCKITSIFLRKIFGSATFTCFFFYKANTVYLYFTDNFITNLVHRIPTCVSKIIPINSQRECSGLFWYSTSCLFPIDLKSPPCRFIASHI